MRKNIKGIAAGSLGLLALQLPGMTVFAQAADRKARLANALQNTVLGMGTVFVMLIAIALIIYCFKIIPVIQKKFAKKQNRKQRHQRQHLLQQLRYRKQTIWSWLLLSQPRSQQVRMYR